MADVPDALVAAVESVFRLDEPCSQWVPLQGWALADGKPAVIEVRQLIWAEYAELRWECPPDSDSWPLSAT